MEDCCEIDRSKWHKPSYLGHYDEKATCYEGIRTRCLKCGRSFVFSAQEQKYAFEVKRVYPGWLPTLCPACSQKWAALEQKILEFEHSWEADRETLESDQAFLANWLGLLREAQPYGKKNFESRIRMLTSTIEGFE
jgi:hypothetical protein